MNRSPFVLCVLCVLCGGNSFAQGEDGAELMQKLQSRLFSARRVVVEADVQARGATFAALRGRVLLVERNHVQLSFSGQFGAQPAVLALTADHRVQELRSGAQSRTEAVGDENNRALLVGLLRVGLLHNLARLKDLQPPDHGQRAVERRITLDNFRPTTYVLGGDLEGTLSFGFDVLVDGAEAGSARLWLDPASGLPRRREQTTRSAAGETTVLENYTKFLVE